MKAFRGDFFTQGIKKWIWKCCEEGSNYTSFEAQQLGVANIYPAISCWHPAVKVTTRRPIPSGRQTLPFPKGNVLLTGPFFGNW